MKLLSPPYTPVIEFAADRERRDGEAGRAATQRPRTEISRAVVEGHHASRRSAPRRGRADRRRERDCLAVD